MRLLRTLGPALAAATALAACEVGQGSPSSDYLRDSALPPLRDGRLEVVDSSESLALGYGEAFDVRVRLRDPDGPVSGATVYFALIGASGGASLQELEVTTDDRGIAGTLLSAGPMDSDFEVRATAAGAAALRIPVAVSDTPLTRLSVEVVYAGGRPLDRQELRVYPGLTCGQLEATDAPPAPLAEATGAGDSSEVRVQIPANSGRLAVQVVGYGVHEDERLAEGCVATDPLSGAQASARVRLADTPLLLRGEYAIGARLEVGEPAARLADAVLASDERLLGDSGSVGGALLLGAAARTLLEADEAQASADFLIAVQGDPARIASIEDTLVLRDQGLDQLLAALSETLEVRGAQLEFTATLTAQADDEAFEFAPETLAARDAEGERPLSLEFESPPEGRLGGTFDENQSALSVQALRLELGLGEYGLSLLDALDAESEDGLAAQLVAQVGCDAFTEWLADDEVLAPLCDADCAARSCEEVARQTLDVVRLELPALDAPHPGIGLRGEVPAHDVDGDGLVDRIAETTLTGGWGRASGSPDLDFVRGTLLGAAAESP